MQLPQGNGRKPVHEVLPRGIIPLEYAPMVITWRETLSYIKRIGVKPGDKVVMIGGEGTQYTVAGTPYYMRWLDQWHVWLKELRDHCNVDKLRKAEEDGTDG